MTIEDLGEGRQKIINLQPDYLFEFVDWYTEWLFSSDKEKISLRDEECKIMEGVLHFAAKVPPDAKGFHKVNINDIQNDSMKDLGRLIRVEELNPVIEKKLVSEKIMEEAGIFVMVNPSEVQKLTKNWSLINNLKKHLR